MSHGTRGVYAKGCHCAECRGANAAYHRAYRRRPVPVRTSWRLTVTEEDVMARIKAPCPCSLESRRCASCEAERRINEGSKR